MNRKWLPIVFSCLCIQLAQASDTSEEARSWLNRMAQAVKNLNYEGTFVYIHGDQLEALQIIHSSDEKGERERLFSLVGAPREILRDSDNLTCILPDNKAVVVEKSRPKKYLPSGLMEITRNLKQYYDFRMLGDDRVAGMPTRVLEITPKDPYRYGYRLWLEKKTAMLLKSDLINRRGKAVEQVMFTEIRIYDKIAPDHLKATIDSAGFKWFRQDEKGADTGKKPAVAGEWQVTRLPGGFHMGMKKRHKIPTSHMPVEHLVYTDGISSVSVYIEKMENSADMLKGFSSMGAVNAYGTVVGDYCVTVVGEVPRAAVKMIGDSVRKTDATNK